MPTINRNSNDYVAIFDRIHTTVKQLPSRVAVLAVNFSKERFEKKDWHDDVPQLWKETKKKRGSTLVASGRLRRSIRKVRVTASQVTIGTDAPYARAHNDGIKISGTERVRSFRRRSHRRKAHTRKGKRIKATQVKEYTVKPYSRKYKRKFVKRQFIGQSRELNRRMDKLIADELNKAIRGL